MSQLKNPRSRAKSDIGRITGFHAKFAFRPDLRDRGGNVCLAAVTKTSASTFVDQGWVWVIGWPKSMGLWGFYEFWPPQKSHWKIKHLVIGSKVMFTVESHTSLIMSRSWTSMVRPQNFCARYQLTSFGRFDVWVILFWEPVCFENRLYSRSTGLYIGWCLISVPCKTRRPSGTLCDCSWSHICFWCRSHHYHTIAFQYHSWLSLSRLSRSHQGFTPLDQRLLRGPLLPLLRRWVEQDDFGRGRGLTMVPMVAIPGVSRWLYLSHSSGPK